MENRNRRWRSIALVGAIFLALAVLAGGPASARAAQAAGGYGYVDSRSGGLDFSYEDIEKTGKIYGKTDSVKGVQDNYDISGSYDPERTNLLAGAPIPIGFPFTFYGRTYESVWPAGNGYIEFTPDDYVNHVYDGSEIASLPVHNLIAPLWGWHDAFS